MDAILIKKKSDSFSYYTIENTIDYVIIYAKCDYCGGLLKRTFVIVLINLLRNVYGYYVSLIIIWMKVKLMYLQLLFYNLFYMDFRIYNDLTTFDICR